MSKYLPEPDFSEYLVTLQTILDRGLESGESKTRKIARWARDQMQPGKTILHRGLESGRGMTRRIARWAREQMQQGKLILHRGL